MDALLALAAFENEKPTEIGRGTSKFRSRTGVTLAEDNPVFLEQVG
jgi:hypothetical protein